jgi:hypothetical protein
MSAVILGSSPRAGLRRERWGKAHILARPREQNNKFDDHAREGPMQGEKTEANNTSHGRH